MFFKQIKHFGDNFSYVVADEASGEAMVVDPSFNAEVVVELVKEKKFNVKYIVNTHGHGDHSAGNEDVKEECGGKVVAHRLSQTRRDISVDDGDVLMVGNVKVEVLYTPGHSPDGICLLVDGKVLTGDTLFIDECGRTDLPGGSAERLYHSFFDKLLKLDDGVVVFPGHDYGPKPYASLGEQRRSNYVLEERSLKEFLAFMSH
jgi:glyoxylase-like metal-dependent hydrolase (beta-lactamase superfamily II)